MKRLIAIICFITAGIFSSFGQTAKVKGTIYADSADLKIVKIFADSFPDVSVVFKAETKNHEPIWNLSKEKMSVRENSKKCDIVSLEQISKADPINLGIVMDHSGSMEIELSSYYSENGDINPDSKSPLENAKTSVKKFVTNFNFKKDLISIVGFSDTIGPKLPLTNSVTNINNAVNAMESTGATALYDAMINGMKEIEQAKGVNVLVVLTDGWDNSSTNTLSEVISNSKKSNIPIYIIGLGDVNKDSMELIARSTNGQFYYTKNSSSLDAIYTSISKQIRAYYNMVYTSSNFSALDTARNIVLSFDIDSLYTNPDSATVRLSAEVITYLKTKEQENKEKEYLLYGGIALIISIGAGVLFFRYRKIKKKNTAPVITKLYPNPASEVVNLSFNSSRGQLKIFDISGHEVKAVNLTGTEQQLNVADLINGTYFATIYAGGQQSNPVKFIKQ